MNVCCICGGPDPEGAEKYFKKFVEIIDHSDN